MFTKISRRPEPEEEGEATEGLEGECKLS